MLDPQKIRTALAAKGSHFTGAERSRSAVLETFRAAFTSLAKIDLETAGPRLAGIDRPGAKPTGEFDRYPELIIPFGERWSNHQQARRWARKVLEGVPTFAVDGSQISPTKDVSIPIGLVQIGWYENMHTPGGEYTKDLAVEVLSPVELSESEQGGDELGSALVHLRRFEMETSRLVEYLRDSAGRSPGPLALFDGTLIISFAGLMQPKFQSKYTDAVLALLDASTSARVPLIGFVDYSSAHDLVDMIAHLTDARPGDQITDAHLLQSTMRWGDRSQVFICARDDNLLANEYYERVCFCYLKTTADLPPARVEFPRWLYESGEHVRALDLLRAECVVGTGYPYALETADAIAVIDAQDRQRFYRLLQRFASRVGIGLRFSRKSMSKRSRR